MSDTNLDCLLLSSLFHNNVCRSKNQGKFTKTGKNFKKKPQTMHFIKLIMLFHEPYILISFLIIRIECYYRAWFVVIVIIHMLLYHLTKKIERKGNAFLQPMTCVICYSTKRKQKGNAFLQPMACTITWMEYRTSKS
jgi:hypothetical protein